MAEKENKAKATPQKERLVRIMIPKVKGDDSDEYIGINGRLFVLQRGKPIDVPWSVYRQLQHKYKMEEEAEFYKSQIGKK